MSDRMYVPFEPGMGADPVMHPPSRAWRRVKQVPPVEAVQEESCLRASAFHPNLPGNVGMFVRIRNVLTAAGRYPPP